ncbi:hypothetical protein [Haloarchaeobius sp. HRN-SO-5]|uniref:hypothetical protein n=1 Tax=Haloarchaeobius sp. HRN-SO-5 TaxID=3446118 RepID=UPI003EB7A511
MTALDAILRPEYTGENRCWPCTVVNVAIVAAVAAVAYLVGYPIVAGVVAAVGLLAVWARGYVVPYTPRFAPRLAAALGVGDRFGHAASPPEGAATGSLGIDADPEAVVDVLLEAGVLAEDEAGLYLTDSFRTRWRDAMEPLRDATPEQLADGVRGIREDADVRAEQNERGAYVVVAAPDGNVIHDAWLTRPVVIAEIAGVHALGGAGLDREARLAAVQPLRSFLEECPDCGGRVEETTTVDCCGGPAGTAAEPDHVLACTECGSRLFTFPE